MSTKQSIRFYKDREVRAVWSDEQNKWYFSATDIVRANQYIIKKKQPL